MQYRRFGRTNLKIPILSLGGMRFQKSWEQLDFSEISNEEQNKVENILDLANKYGLSHVETAKYYGTSEVLLGMGFKNIEKIPNIIQTKIPPNSDPEIFRRDFMASIEKLKVKRIDLLAIHGINTDEHLYHAVKDGGCIDILRNLQKENLIDFCEKIAEPLEIPVIAGVFLLKSYKNALFINKYVPGANIPENILNRLKDAKDPLQEGIKIAAEQAHDFFNIANGVHLMAVKSEYLIPEIIEKANLSLEY